MLKDSLCHELLTNLGAKGSKRSVNNRVTTFCKSFFQNKIVVHERWAVKNSFMTYVCYAPDVFFLTVLYMLQNIIIPKTINFTAKAFLGIKMDLFD